MPRTNQHRPRCRPLNMVPWLVDILTLLFCWFLGCLTYLWWMDVEAGRAQSTVLPQAWAITGTVLLLGAAAGVVFFAVLDICVVVPQIVSKRSARFDSWWDQHGMWVYIFLATAALFTIFGVGSWLGSFSNAYKQQDYSLAPSFNVLTGLTLCAGFLGLVVIFSFDTWLARLCNPRTEAPATQLA